MGLSGLVGVSEGVLEEAAVHLPDMGLHASVGEDEADLAHVFSRTSRRPGDLLAAHGLLGPRTVVAHAGTTTHSEAVALADSGTTLAVTPRAAMFWGAPFPPILPFAALGVRVAFGTDGLFPDVAGEAVAAAMMHRYAERSAGAAAGLVGRVAWPSAARLASELFGDGLGTLESGALADVAVVDWRPEVPLPDVPAGDLAVLWAGSPAAWVIVDGEVRLREGRLLGADEERIAARAREAAAALLEA
jgi:5-methylthioadenosine/S-adenosylhomocysteine deaminase